MNAFLGGLLAPLVTLIPGFVLVSVYRRNRHGNDSSDARFAAAAFVASILPHLVVLWWSLDLVRTITADPNSLSPWRLAAWVIVVTLLLPAALGFGLSVALEFGPLERLLGKAGWSRAARTRSAWEWAMLPAKPSWVVVTLRDGTLLGGQFGEGSFASLDPDRRDMFIRHPHRIRRNGTFGQPIDDALGLWIDGDDIQAVEFYEGSE